MSGVQLGEALESITAEVILWSAAPDHPGARKIATDLAALATRGHPGPELRGWLEQLARWFDSRDEGADAAAATDAMLASIDWASGATAQHEGVSKVLADLGMTGEDGLRRIEALNREARAGLATAPASAGMVHEDAPLPAQPGHASESGTAATLAELPEPAAADLAVHPRDAATPDAPIWVSVEERDLVVATVHGEFLPRLMFLTEHADVPRADPEAGFFVETVSNALSVVGLESCSQLLNEAGRTALAGGDIDEVAELANWLVQLTAWLGAEPEGDPFGSFAAEEFVGATRNLARLARDGELATRVAAETRRLRVGLSPTLREKPRRTAQPDDLDLAPAPDVIPAVLQGMLRELPGHADALITSLSAIADGTDPSALDRARRTAHTLKGDANTVGIRGLANLTHALEDIFVEVERRAGTWPEGLLALVAEAADLAATMADHVLGRGPAPADALELLERVYAVADAMERDEQPPEFVTSRPAADPAPAAEVAAAPTPPAPAEARPDDLVTLPRAVVDRLLRLASESIALGNQLRGAVEATVSLQAGLGEEVALVHNAGRALDEQVAFRGTAIAERRRKDIEIDPLELDEYNELYVVSRRVQETAADVRERLIDLVTAGQRVESLLTRKQRVDEDLQSLVRRSRLVPVREHRARFERAVRQAARMVGKDVQFRLTGEALAVDKLLLDGLVEPLMHLLRNAVDHGIEDSAQRSSAGKSSTGLVALSFAERAQVLEIEVADDGAGLDLEAIHRRGIRLGLIEDGDQPAATLKSLLFRPGFSTRDAVTQVSGRGIGLDVVASRVRELGGTVAVDDTPGAGTRFALRVPLAVGALQVALVPLGGHTQAIATDSFARFQPIGVDQQRRAPDGATEVLVDERWLPAVELAALLGVHGEHCAGRVAVGAVVGAATDPGVVLCPRVEALSLVVLESLAGSLPVIPGLRGAAVLGDGSAAPVIDLGEYWRTRDDETRLATQSISPTVLLPRIVVADDSLTIRQSLGDLLVDSGYRVELARDGLEALMLCEREVPAALLVDLEMPRMNGLELVAHLRKDPRFAPIPIVMITSRTADRHRAMAEAAGVDAVLAKPYDDDDVLQLLASRFA